MELDWRNDWVGNFYMSVIGGGRLLNSCTSESTEHNHTLVLHNTKVPVMSEMMLVYQTIVQKESICV